MVTSSVPYYKHLEPTLYIDTRKTPARMGHKAMCHRRLRSRSPNESPPRLPPHEKAMAFLISAIALAGLRPFGHVRVQLRMVWQRYTLMELSIIALRSSVRSSRESASQR